MFSKSYLMHIQCENKFNNIKLIYINLRGIGVATYDYHWKTNWKGRHIYPFMTPPSRGYTLIITH